MSNLKIKISVEKTDFDYDKCMLNNKHTKVTTVQVKSLQSLLFNTVLILFVKKGILGQNKICSHNFRIKNLINGGTVCIDVFKGDEVYDNHARTIYGKVWLKIQVDWKETLSSEKQSLQSGIPLHTRNTEEKQTYDVAHRPNNIDFAAKSDQDKFKAPNLQHLTALPTQYTKSADNLSTVEIFETPTQKFTPFDDYVSTERVLQILNDNHFTDQIEQNKDDIFNKMFTTLFDRQMAEKYSSSVPQLKRLFQYIAKGSFSCHLKFWTGLLVLESHYKQNGNMQFNFRAKTRNICNQEHHSTGELTERLEDKVYNAIAAYNKRVSRNHGFYAHYLNLYYYAIAPYGNSVMTYGIKNRANHDTSTIEGSVLRFLNIDAKDLIITNLPDKPDVQYIAFYDAQHDRLVISFRGTHNHIDAINDLDCEYQMFYEGYAHQGFVKIVNDFRHNHLDKIKKILKERKIRKVLLTGQSLGGAICHIANIVIKREKLLEDIEVEVVAFQSPPAVSKEFIDQDNATNVIHGYDIFPRLSFGSLLDLKYLSISVVTMLNLFSRVNTSEFIRKVNNFLQRTDMNAKLYLPGKIYHVHSEDKVFYKSIDCEELMNIVVHIKNFWDHSFQSMIRALEKGKAEKNE